MSDVAPYDVDNHTVARPRDAEDGPASGRGARARGALIVGGVIAAVITVATISIIHMTARAGCPPAGCAAGSGRTAVPDHTTGQPTVQPAGGATTAPSAVRTDTARTTSPPLAAVMPADIRLRACRTTDYDPFLADVSAYFACQQPANAQLPYLQVWGYQFADQATYERGFEAFNAFVKFDPAAAEDKCPPVATYGSVEWHTSAAPDDAAGTLECYSDSSENHYYVWTDDTERTILVAESAPTQTFADLDAWWRRNNRNA